LADDFGLLVEREDYWFISLVFLDLHKTTFCKLHTIELPGSYLYVGIIVNKAEPTEFVLQYESENDQKFIRACKVDRTKLIIGDEIEVEADFRSYHNGCLYKVSWTEDEDEDEDFLTGVC
jgi:hypothetical protein